MDGGGWDGGFLGWNKVEWGAPWWVALGGDWERTQPLFINSDAHKECKVSTVQIYI